MSGRRLIALSLLALTSCAEPMPAAKPARSISILAATDADAAGAESYTFAPLTHSAQAPTTLADEGTARSRHCNAGDLALDRVAERLATRQARAQPGFDAEEIAFALRAAGAPYVWPRAWTLEGPVADAAVSARMSAWLESFSNGGERRCGVARVRKDAATWVTAAVAVDALADLEPVPTRVRVGQWVDVAGTMLVPAGDAKIVVLGPRGAPHAVPSSLSGAKVLGRFNADREGVWLAQVLASVSGGPRPVLEALVYAGIEPPSRFEQPQAPGEDAARANPQSDADSAYALELMLNAARKSEARLTLRRDAGLDRVAEEHARTMRAMRRIAHDLGHGDPQARVVNAGLDFGTPGENVAHAADVQHAHRMLWASPSHRENLLFTNFDAIGIGVARDSDGTVWVCELFAAIH